ncbi:uncharacterized protein ACB058_012011 [Synchiropus picturatus]
MERTLILLLLFAGQTQAFFSAADSHCDATQSSAQCSVTLGASVYIQVLATAEGYRLRCLKQLPVGHVSVFSVRRDIVTVQETFRDRTHFFIKNGTLKITGVERADAGEFSVEVFSTDGMLVRTIHVKLDVKENVLPVVALACSALVLLLILVAASCCIYKKVKHHKKAAKQRESDNRLWASI